MYMYLSRRARNSNNCTIVIMPSGSLALPVWHPLTTTFAVRELVRGDNDDDERRSSPNFARVPSLFVVKPVPVPV